MNAHTEEVAGYFNQPEAYLKNGFDIAVRKKIITQLLGDISNKHILDMGCGNGALSMDYLEHNQVHFVDLAEKMLDIVRKRVQLKFADKAPIIQQDTLSSFKANEQYDIVLAIGLLAHVKDIPASIAKMAELLRPGGKLVIQMTDYDQWLSKLYFTVKSIKPSYHQVTKLSYSKVEKILTSNKLMVQSCVNYSMMVPGLGVFSDAIKEKVQLWSIDKSIALDKIILLEKQ